MVLKLPDWPPVLMSEQLPPPEPELLLDEELELELLDELELLEDELLLELELLEDELELDELLPPQSAACGPLPVTVNQSIFAKPPPVVATRLRLFQPALKLAFTLATVQPVHEPVDGNSIVVTLSPLISTLPGRLPAPLANRHSSR